MLRILIVDDHAIVREGLKQILAATPDLAVHGEASSAAEAIDKVQAGSWDAVVLDLSLPDRSGIEVLHAIRSLAAPPPVLILSAHDEE